MGEVGFPLSFGVFQEYYSHQPEFKDNSPMISAIGTVSSSIYFLAAPFASPLVRRYQKCQQYLFAAGWTLCAVSLLAASFASSVKLLILTQGVLYGFGFLMVYLPVIRMLDEWFIQRRGFAYGFLYAGGGISGAGLPFLSEWLLSTTGHRMTLRVFAGIQFIALFAGILLLRPRLPPSSAVTFRNIDLTFFRKPLFWFFMVSNIFQGFAYYMPSLYLPTFASAAGLSPSIGALLLASNNLASTAGQLGLGYLSDNYSNIHILVFATTCVSAVSALAIWGFATSVLPLVVFSVLYGLCAGSYVIFWTKFGSILSEDPQPVYSLMAFGKGIGNIMTGPVSAALLTKPLTSGYGMGRFAPMIVFVGVLMMLSSLQITWLPFVKLRKIYQARARL